MVGPGYRNDDDLDLCGHLHQHLQPSGAAEDGRALQC
jgi:hypothetical protein